MMMAVITSLELFNDGSIIVPLWFQVIGSRKTGLAAGLGCDTKTLLLTEGKIIKAMTVERLKK